MAGLTFEEITAVNQLRERVSDILPQIKDDFDCRDDSLLIWIRDVGMNLSKAESAFRTSIKWRLENNIDALRDSHVDPVYVQKFPYYLDGLTKIGEPVLSTPFGEWDFRSSVETEGNSSKVVQHYTQMMEKAVGEIKGVTLKKGKDVERVQCVLIVDAAGLSHRQVTSMKALQALLEVVRVGETHYPGVMRNIFLINAPAVFSVGFRVVKPFLSGRTMDRLQIFSGRKDQWQPPILELIDPSQIRERFGGTKAE